MISMYYECTPDFPQSVSPYVGDLHCEVNEKSYYVTTNLSSPLLHESGDFSKDLGGMYHLHGQTCGNKGMEYAFGSVAIILIAGGLFCIISWRRKTSNIPRQFDLKTLIPLKHYSYAEVKRITKSFDKVVGKGGFGTVYRGTLSDGRIVAVKVLKDTKGNGEDFINEVSSMSKTSHVNIVTLLGFCAEGTKRAIL
uniref:Protein kinase domain-containing protein n=1 Tax=Brassica oleracea TaxID=3712 RepID=A0A3P6H6C3_BRAOL|nr:unnamed protein product [Brassica oleracea]